MIDLKRTKKCKWIIIGELKMNEYYMYQIDNIESDYLEYPTVRKCVLCGWSGTAKKCIRCGGIMEMKK